LNAVIEAEHLRKTFGSLVAVADLSFSVVAGECFGILDPNGAGKTSTIRMVYAFSPPSGGTLHVLGLDIVPDLPIYPPPGGNRDKDIRLDIHITSC
jgi:ABC-type multidrug transport system ATPase subunit